MCARARTRVAGVAVALNAGLFVEGEDHRFSLALEPEVASVFIQSEAKADLERGAARW